MRLEQLQDLDLLKDSERVGFEPTVQFLTIQLLSRKPLSTTQPPLQVGFLYDNRLGAVVERMCQIYRFYLYL